MNENNLLDFNSIENFLNERIASANRIQRSALRILGTILFICYCIAIFTMLSAFNPTLAAPSLVVLFIMGHLAFICILLLIYFCYDVAIPYLIDWLKGY